MNRVDDVPKQFKDWVKNNEERIGKAKSLPYFLKDNRKMLTSGKYGYMGERFGHSLTRKEKAALEGHQELHDYSPEQVQNFKQITKTTKYERGKPMSFDEADHGKANIIGDKKTVLFAYSYMN